MIKEVRFAPDSALEREGYELSVPRQRISVFRVIRSVACEGYGAGADVSVQPGFVIIMALPPEASGAPLCCPPVDPEDDERDQMPQSERYVGQNHANIWRGQER